VWRGYENGISRKTRLKSKDDIFNKEVADLGQAKALQQRILTELNKWVLSLSKRPFAVLQKRETKKGYSGTQPFLSTSVITPNPKQHEIIVVTLQ